MMLLKSPGEDLVPFAGGESLELQRRLCHESYRAAEKPHPQLNIVRSTSNQSPQQ